MAPRQGASPPPPGTSPRRKQRDGRTAPRLERRVPDVEEPSLTRAVPWSPTDYLSKKDRMALAHVVQSLGAFDHRPSTIQRRSPSTSEKLFRQRGRGDPQSHPAEAGRRSPRPGIQAAPELKDRAARPDSPGGHPGSDPGPPRPWRASPAGRPANRCWRKGSCRPSRQWFRACRGGLFPRPLEGTPYRPPGPLRIASCPCPFGALPASHPPGRPDHGTIKSCAAPRQGPGLRALPFAAEEVGIDEKLGQRAAIDLVFKGRGGQRRSPCVR